jgi:hypothetical protein
MTCPRNILNKQEGPDRVGYVDGTASSCSGTNCAGVGAGGRVVAASCSLPHAPVTRAQNRNGAIAAATAIHADGYAERGAALFMLEKKQQGRACRIRVGRSRLTTRRIVRTVREMNVTPQIIRNDRNRSSNLYHRTTRQPGKRAFAIGERVRSYFDGLATK